MMLIGDMIETAAASIGVTPERIVAVTGKPCGCKKRKDAINKSHLTLVIRWHKARADSRVWFRRALMRLAEPKRRVVMAWKSLRYGNPHLPASSAAAIFNARKEPSRGKAETT